MLLFSTTEVKEVAKPALRQKDRTINRPQLSNLKPEVYLGDSESALTVKDCKRGVVEENMLNLREVNS